MRKATTTPEPISFPSPHSPAWEDIHGHTRWTTTSPQLADTVNKKASTQGRARLLAVSPRLVPQKQKIMGSLPATWHPSLLSTVAAVGLGSLRDTASGREWRGLAWVSNLLFAPDFPARMRRSRRKRLKQGPLLPALVGSFELKLCKSSPSTNSFPVGVLWSLVHIFTVVWTPEAPLHPWVSWLWPTGLPSPFLLPNTLRDTLISLSSPRPGCSFHEQEEEEEEEGSICSATTQQCWNRESHQTAC